MSVRTSVIVSILVLVANASVYADGGILVPAHLDFGTVNQGAVVTKQIAILNGGSSAAEHLSVESSCDCTSIISAPKRLAPNQTGVVTLRYAPNKAGDAKIDVLIVAKIGKLKSISQISGVAKIIETHQTAPPQLGCPPAEIQAEVAIKEQGLVFVDTRGGIEYDKVRIPGSLNLPLYAIKAQEFLKFRSLIIVTDAVSVSEAQSEIAKLRESGFRSVRNLRGGIRAWGRAGGALEGGSILTAGFVKLDRLAEVEQSPLWDCRFIANGKDVEALAASVKKPEGVDQAYVLAIAAERNLYDQIEAKLGTSKRLVFYLNGTVSDWIKYHSAERSLAAHNPLVIGSTQSNSTAFRSGKGSPCKTCH